MNMYICVCLYYLKYKRIKKDKYYITAVLISADNALHNTEVEGGRRGRRGVSTMGCIPKIVGYPLQ